MRAYLQRPLAQRALTVVAVIVVVAALFYLAVALPDADFLRGEGIGSLLSLGSGSGPPPPTLNMSPRFWDYFRIFFWSSTLLALIYLLSSREGRRELPGIVRGALVSFIIGNLLWIIVFTLHTAFNDDTVVFEEPVAESPIEEPTAVSPGTAPVEDPAFTQPEPPPVVAILFSITVGAGAGYLLYRWWQYRQTYVGSHPSLKVLQQRAQRTLQALRLGHEPVDDVIRRCYREMAQTVYEQRGVRRADAVTPREFELTLQQNGLPLPPVQRLTRLFEQVRYGNIAIGERERREAIDSLEKIVAACERQSRQRAR